MNDISHRAIVRLDDNVNLIPLPEDKISSVRLYVPDLSLSTPSADDRSGVLSFVEEALAFSYPGLEVRRFALDGSSLGQWGFEEDKFMKSGDSFKTQEGLASIILTNNAHVHRGQADLLKKVSGHSVITVHVALRNPYDLNILDDDGVVRIATLGFRHNSLVGLVEILRGMPCSGSRVFS
jgi:hypothetical protein